MTIVRYARCDFDFPLTIMPTIIFFIFTFSHFHRRKEMADLQSNVKQLSSKIQGTFASHEGKLPFAYSFRIILNVKLTKPVILNASSNDRCIPGEISKDIDDANVVNDQRYNANVDSTDHHPSRDETDASRVTYQGYDSSSADDQPITDQNGSEMYSRMRERNAQSQKNHHDISNDRIPVDTRDEAESEITTETMPETYRREGGACSDDPMYTDPNVDTYMVEQEYDRYNEYDPSRYQEEQYDVNDQRFKEITQEPEDHRTISDAVKSDH